MACVLEMPRARARSSVPAAADVPPASRKMDAMAVALAAAHEKKRGKKQLREQQAARMAAMKKRPTPAPVSVACSESPTFLPSDISAVPYRRRRPRRAARASLSRRETMERPGEPDRRSSPRRRTKLQHPSRPQRCAPAPSCTSRIASTPPVGSSGMPPATG